MSHERHVVSNHRQLHCMFNSLFRLRTKKTLLHLYFTFSLWGKSLMNNGSPQKETVMSQIARFMWPTWGPPGPHVSPMNLVIRGRNHFHAMSWRHPELMLFFFQVFWAFGACFIVLLSLFIMPNLGWRWLLGFASLPLLIFTMACIVS